MENCPFCRIVRGEIPARKIYEDERSLIFLDIAGDADGHMLAIPKAHAESILDCKTEDLKGLMDAVQRVSRHLVLDRGYDGVNLLNASGAAAGQSVPHLHVHILPRRSADGLDAWPKLPGAQEDLDALHGRLTMLKEMEEGQ